MAQWMMIIFAFFSILLFVIIGARLVSYFR